MISGRQVDIEVLSGLLYVFFLLLGPVSFLIFGVIVSTVNIVIDMLGSTPHCDFLLQPGLLFLLSGRIVMFILEIDDIEVSAAVQFPLGIVFGEDDVAILHVIITEFLSVDQVVQVPDGCVVFLGLGGRVLGEVS